MHSPDQSARHILGYYRKLDRRAGDVLRRQTFNQPFGEAGWRQEDFDSGMAWAISRGWFEENGPWYELTHKGVRAYEMLPSARTWWSPARIGLRPSGA